MVGMTAESADIRIFRFFRHGLLASASARRSAGLGLTLVLVGLSAAAVIGSWEQAAVAKRAASATASAAAYDQARYLSEAQHAALHELLAEPANDEAQTAHRKAATRFLHALISLQRSNPGDDRQLDAAISGETKYLLLTDRFLALSAAGRVEEAETLHESTLDPAVDGLLQTVSALAENNRAKSVTAIQEMRHSTRLLQVGTPIAFAVGLLLLSVFGLVIRGHRRAVEVQATHDALTGLPNRTLFQARCKQALSAATRSGRMPVVLLLDLDDFKQVNDTLGHHFGDQLLVSMATRLREAVRPGDTVARLGGDEFALLLPDGGADAGTQVAGRIAGLLERPFLLDGISLDVETSIGIATASPADKVLDLVRHADTAMYVAKKYKLGHAHYTAEQDENSIAKLTLLSDVRRALEADEFELHYQPKIAMDSGELIGVEALARWRHPTRGMVMPAEFIPATDAMSLCFRFTTHVIGKALAHTRSWIDRGVELPVAVNVSTRSLLDQRLPEAVAALLHTHRVPPHLLSLEITEDTIMADPDNALNVLGRIRQLGVKTSIDDFGTGYSSMSYLKRLPVDELKIDRSFVGDMATDPKNAMLVQSTIELGHNLGLSVTAEGVEDHATLEALQGLSCDVAQGYYFAKPLPPDVLAAWIASQPRRGSSCVDGNDSHRRSAAVS